MTINLRRREGERNETYLNNGNGVSNDVRYATVYIAICEQYCNENDENYDEIDRYENEKRIGYEN
jgi:hypothetical protein